MPTVVGQFMPGKVTIILLYVHGRVWSGGLSAADFGGAIPILRSTARSVELSLIDKSIAKNPIIWFQLILLSLKPQNFDFSARATKCLARLNFCLSVTLSS